jgi:hypothetical protein
VANQKSAKDNYGALISYLARFGTRGKAAKQAIGNTAGSRSDKKIINDVKNWLVKK